MNKVTEVELKLDGFYSAYSNSKDRCFFQISHGDCKGKLVVIIDPDRIVDYFLTTCEFHLETFTNAGWAVYGQDN
jgi:hypothetical protein